MPKITSIDGYKQQQEELQKTINFEPVNVFCDNCNGGLFAWKVDVNNDSNHLIVCATCQNYYPILDAQDLLGLLTVNKDEAEPEETE